MSDYSTLNMHALARVFPQNLPAAGEYNNFSQVQRIRCAAATPGDRVLLIFLIVAPRQTGVHGTPSAGALCART